MVIQRGTGRLKQMNNKTNTLDTGNDEFDLTKFHASFIVSHLIPDSAEHYGLCLGCLAREVVRQLQEHLTHLEHDEPIDDTIGAAKGNA
jgi:hypothetical protein